MTNTTRGKKIVIQAYGLLENMPLDDGWTLTLPIYRRKADAQHTKRVHGLKKWKVIPVKITYENLP